MIVRVLAVGTVLSLIACIAIVLATSAGVQTNRGYNGGIGHVLAPAP